MIKNILILLCLLLSAACTTSQIKTSGKTPTAPATCEASSTAAFMSADKYQATACNGSLGVDGGGVDPAFTALINALIQMSAQAGRAAMK